MRQSPDDMNGLSAGQSISKPGACLADEFRVDGIDVKGQVEGVLVVWVEVFNALAHDFADTQLIHMVHCEAFHFVLLQRDVLISVDIPDRDEHHILGIEEGVISQPLPGRKMREDSHSSQMRKGHSMVVVAEGNIRSSLPIVYAVRMGIHPDKLQVFMQAMGCRNGGCAH